MSLVARDTSGGGGDFTPCPQGLHNAVCVDIVDLGDVLTIWEGKESYKHKCRIAWQVEELMEDGNPFTVMQRYTVSLHENSALRPILESWRGKLFTQEELDGFDLENVYGAPCQVQVVHRLHNGKTYANVQSVVPKGKNDPRLEPNTEAYTRVKDREGYEPPYKHQAQPEPTHDAQGPDSYEDPDDDESLPF